MSITQSHADVAIEAARAAADELGIPMNVAILDDGANLKAFVRMDGALLGAVDVAIRKAKTSALFGTTSENIGEWSKPDGGAPGLTLTNGGLVGFAGGLPIRDRNGAVVGAVGVSGGAAEQDRTVALAAAEAARRI